MFGICFQNFPDNRLFRDKMYCSLFSVPLPACLVFVNCQLPETYCVVSYPGTYSLTGGKIMNVVIVIIKG